MGRRLRVVVVGLGSMGRRRAQLLRAAGAEVVTVDPVRPADATSLEGVLEGADAAVVASPSTAHEAQAVTCLLAGVPTLVEKPLALDALGARRVRAAARASGAAVGVAMNLRHHPGVLGVRGSLPGIGRPVTASAWCGSHLPWWHPDEDYRRGYSAQRSLGGGVLLDAVHEVDELTWLLGPVRSVGAVLAHASDLEVDVEDVAQLHLEHGSGTLSSITLDYVDRAYSRGCRVVGTRGTAAWSWSAGAVETTGADGRTSAAPAPSDVAPTYRREVEELLAGLPGRTGGASADEAVHVLDVVDAARASSARGERVHVGVALRPARVEDSAAALAWRNDPAAVAASATGRPVAAAEHERWWPAAVQDPDRRVWVVEASGAPVGTVRLDLRDGGRAVVSVALDAAVRGLGLGRAAITEAVAAAPPGVGRLEALVRPDNRASLRAFAAAGFTRSGSDGSMALLVLAHAQERARPRTDQAGLRRDAPGPMSSRTTPGRRLGARDHGGAP